MDGRESLEQSFDIVMAKCRGCCQNRYDGTVVRRRNGRGRNRQSRLGQVRTVVLKRLRVLSTVSAVTTLCFLRRPLHVVSCSLTATVFFGFDLGPPVLRLSLSLFGAFVQFGFKTPAVCCRFESVVIATSFGQLYLHVNLVKLKTKHTIYNPKYQASRNCRQFL